MWLKYIVFIPIQKYTVSFERRAFVKTQWRNILISPLFLVIQAVWIYQVWMKQKSMFFIRISSCLSMVLYCQTVLIHFNVSTESELSQPSCLKLNYVWPFWTNKQERRHLQLPFDHVSCICHKLSSIVDL